VSAESRLEEAQRAKGPHEFSMMLLVSCCSMGLSTGVLIPQGHQGQAAVSASFAASVAACWCEKRSQDRYTDVQSMRWGGMLLIGAETSQHLQTVAMTPLGVCICRGQLLHTSCQAVKSCPGRPPGYVTTHLLCSLQARIHMLQMLTFWVHKVLAEAYRLYACLAAAEADPGG
jgi:hypothetical protein